LNATQKEQTIITSTDIEHKQRMDRDSDAEQHSVQIMALNYARMATCEFEHAKKIPFNIKMRSETCVGVKVS
jgi:hypothetical protein